MSFLLLLLPLVMLLLLLEKERMSGFKHAAVQDESC
jgi:L-lactate permease